MYVTKPISTGLYPNLDLWTANKLHLQLQLQKIISPVGNKAWNPIVKLTQCWDKECRFLEDRDGQQEESHYEST